MMNMKMCQNGYPRFWTSSYYPLDEHHAKLCMLKVVEEMEWKLAWRILFITTEQPWGLAYKLEISMATFYILRDVITKWNTLKYPTLNQHKMVDISQGSFWVWAQPMRDDVTQCFFTFQVLV